MWSTKRKSIVSIWSCVGLMGLGAVVGWHGLGFIGVFAIVSSAVAACAD